MENEKYWKDEEYIIAIKNYSKYRQMCYSLNQFDSNNDLIFQKMDEWAVKKVLGIKNNS